LFLGVQKYVYFFYYYNRPRKKLAPAFIFLSSNQ
jgi:hypothetical protein